VKEKRSTWWRTYFDLFSFTFLLLYTPRMPKPLTRCAWVALDDPLYVSYHDDEWGVPVRDDRHLFEMVCLEGQQAGLSWRTILNKRATYRKAFANFDAAKIARFDDAKVAMLLQDVGIVRNRLKVNAIIGNARSYLALKKELGSFSDFLWGFVEGKTIVNHWAKITDAPTKTPHAEAMSKALLKRGFKFVGPTICYAFMQAVGMVNDHTTDCYLYRRK
jgi:DNA-3-methyladenine glycosylase I